MHKKTQLMASIILLTILPTAEAARLKTELRACSVIQSDDERLACYDALLAPVSDDRAENQSKQVQTDHARTEHVQTEQAPKQITDDVGIKHAPPPKEKKVESYAVVVTSCESSRSAKRIFRLDNGQIWQQKNTKYVSKRDCKTEGLITRDYFGYQLFLKSNDHSFRVSRIR